jgi:hypothetical protein
MIHLRGEKAPYVLKVPSFVEVEIILRVRHTPRTLEKIVPIYIFVNHAKHGHVNNLFHIYQKSNALHVLHKYLSSHTVLFFSHHIINPLNA